jgi:hypothetical protein
MVGAHPTVLIVTGKNEIVFQLAKHEARMIVGGRIDQVTDNLFG